MAKIPRLRSQNRIAPGGSGQLLNPSDASRKERAIQQVGRDISAFGGQLDTYFKEKERVDLANFSAEWNNKAMKKGQEGELFAKMNPEGARDGSSVQDDFSSVFNSLKDEAQKIDDDKKKAVALQAINRAEQSYRNKLITYQVSKHNSFVLEKGQEILNDYTFRIQNDPTQVGEVLREFDSWAEQMPYTGKNKESFLRTGRRSIVKAGLQSLALNGQYDKAREVLNETAAGRFFSQEERQNLTDDLFDREVKESNRKYTIEEREIKKLERERQELSRNNLIDIISKMHTAGSPELEAEQTQRAQRLFSQGRLSLTDFRASTAIQDGINEDRSHGLRVDYFVDYYRGATYKEIEQKVISSMAAREMSHVDGEALLNKLKEKQQKEAKDPDYKEAKQRAKDLIRARIPKQEGLSGFFFGQDSKLLIYKVDKEADMLEDKGMAPEKAAEMALAKYLGPERLTTGDLAIEGFGKNLDKLREYKGILAIRLQKGIEAGTLSVEDRRILTNEFNETKLRIEQLNYEERYKELLKLNSSEDN